jgi:hypothetical protein
MAVDDVDALFVAPLRSFVQERKRVAQALKQAGRRDEAKTVEKLPRPTVSAWAVNQVARREPDLVRQLGALTAELQAAHGPRFTEVMQEHRALLGTLRDKAEAVLAADGHPTGPQLLARVVSDLRAGIADAETRPLIENGRLARDVEETGFGTAFADDGGGASAPAPATARAHQREEKPSDDKAARRREEAARREREAEQRRERQALSRAVDKARAAHAAAEKTLERSERERAEARRRLDDAEQAVGEVRDERERLARELAHAEEALRRAEAAAP